LVSVKDARLRYPHVFAPISINGARLKHRIVRTAHGTNYPDGLVNERFIAFHEARARGGAALTILEVASVHPTSPGRFVVYDDRAVAGYRTLVERVAPYDMRVFQQLWHGGAHSLPRDGTPAWSASAVPSIEVGAVPVEMTQGMIEEIVGAYAAAARRCEEGGLGGVEIHAAHGYLLSQFLSPLTNLREDDYGGPLPNRMRIVREVLQAVRAAVEPTFAVGIRLSSTELVDGGLSVEDTARIATELAAAGLVDYVNFSIGSFYVGHTIVAPLHAPHGYQVPYAAEISRLLDVPTVVAGRIMDLAEAEAILASGAADLVSMVRATIADPDLVAKSLEGREAEVRPCIGANQSCVGGIYGPRRRLGCDVNADVGNEHRLEPLTSAATPRRVVVAGAGPAGMEAARLAALRGHDVTVYEARAQVGGAAAVARRAPFCSDFGRFCDWQADELRRLGVPLHLESPVEPDLVRTLAPDVVVVATGSTPRRDGFQLHDPDKVVPGADLDHVLTVAEEADAVVLVSRPLPNDGLAHDLRATCETHLVGDASSPRDLGAAVADATRVARAL
jgi:2,4-dienoyl-CoA reductase-like NADH-dependent reductase (Old Yellow Enzyme family)